MLRSRSLDPDGKSVYQKHLTTNLSGIIHDEFALDRTSALGNYYVQVTGGQGPMTGNFEVQEYKKPEYEVHVTAEKARVLAGRESRSDHRFALLLWRAGQRGESRIFGLPGATIGVRFGDDPMTTSISHGSENERRRRRRSPQERKGSSIPTAKLQIQVRRLPSPNGRRFRYRIEARVTEPGRREIAGNGYGPLRRTEASWSMSRRSNMLRTAGSQGNMTIEARWIMMAVPLTPTHDVDGSRRNGCRRPTSKSREFCEG